MPCLTIQERPGTFGWAARSSPREQVPRFDTLTFTREHASWVDQSWGFDVLLALIVDSWGWSAAIGLASLGLATLYAAMARGLIRDGTSPVVAVVVALLGDGDQFDPFPDSAAPLYICVRLPDIPRLPKAAPERRLGGRGGADLHGGAGEPARRLCGAARDRGDGRDRPCRLGSLGRARRRNVIKFGRPCWRVVWRLWPTRMASGSTAMSCNLLVSSGVTSLIIEYQPAPFGKPEAEVLEWVLLALSACRSCRRGGSTATSWPTSGVAAPGADVDSQRTALCPGGGAGPGNALGRPASCRADVMET